VLSSVQTEQARKRHGKETWPSRIRKTAERSCSRAGFEQRYITCCRAGNGTKLAEKDYFQEQKLGALGVLAVQNHIVLEDKQCPCAKSK
jgi:hypothetical protein